MSFRLLQESELSRKSYLINDIYCYATLHLYNQLNGKSHARFRFRGRGRIHLHMYHSHMIRNTPHLLHMHDHRTHTPIPAPYRNCIPCLLRNYFQPPKVCKALYSNLRYFCKSQEPPQRFLAYKPQQTYFSQKGWVRMRHTSSSMVKNS